MSEKIAKYIPFYNACLFILAAVALTNFLVYTKSVLMPFVIALFIFMVSNTIADWMNRRWRLPRPIGLAITGILFLGFIAFSVLFVTNSIETFIQGADSYSQKLNDTIDWGLAFAQKMGLSNNPQLLESYLNKIPIFNMVKSMGGSLVSVFTTTSLVCLFAIFLFMGNATEKNSFVSNIEKQISYYIIIKILVSLLAAVLVWIVLALLSTELAIMLALITFVLNFIPNIGPFISTVVPLPVLFLQYGFDWHIILALSLLTAIHFVVGNILETKWLGKGMDLNPVVVIASLIFWALVWGVMGALLAVPLTSIIKMVLERYEPTKPFAGLLAGKILFK